MPKYKVRFIHTVEETYTVRIEAENAKKAEELIEEDAFQYVENWQEPEDQQGLDVKIVKIVKIDEEDE
jgi:hypothetical protein